MNRYKFKFDEFPGPPYRPSFSFVVHARDSLDAMRLAISRNDVQTLPDAPGVVMKVCHLGPTTRAKSKTCHRCKAPPGAECYRFCDLTMENP